jgi:peptidoglycan/LPS O-acetylase OafA/YrhL
VEATGSLGDQFERLPNALNGLRLFLALEVVAWHALALRGGHLPPQLQGFVSDVGVDAFLAISGLLICRSWGRRPSVVPFLVARARRLLPGLWVCLLVTAFIIAPLGCLLGGNTVPTPAESAQYAVSNAGIQVRAWGIGDSPAGLEHAAWNGSLWSLSWEVYCYLTVALLGVGGILNGRCLGVLVGVAWSYSVVLEAAGVPPSGPEMWWMPQRAALMFGLGALLWCHRDKIQMRGCFALCAVTATALSIPLLSNYRILGAAGVAYLCVYCALRLGKVRSLRISNDLSYGVYIYAFPLQQAVLLVTGPSIGWASFLAASVAVTLPIAYLSWRLVERPLLRRRPAQRAAAATQRSRAALAAPESIDARARSIPAARASWTGAPGAS